MLAKTYRFTVYNSTGATVATATVKAIRKKFDTSGALSFEGSEGTVASVSALGTGSYSSGSTVDNSSDKYVGGDFEFEVVISAGSPSGDVLVYYQRSTDGGTSYDTDGYGDVVGVLNFTGTGTKRVTFEL
jgi:hypothetical protein